jgi:hypothetical protein
MRPTFMKGHALGTIKLLVLNIVKRPLRDLTGCSRDVQSGVGIT